jgi:hypothetical protein
VFRPAFDIVNGYIMSNPTAEGRLAAWTQNAVGTSTMIDIYVAALAGQLGPLKRGSRLPPMPVGRFTKLRCLGGFILLAMVFFALDSAGWDRRSQQPGTTATQNRPFSPREPFAPIGASGHPADGHNVPGREQGFIPGILGLPR